jgi:hypothetical protein
MTFEFVIVYQRQVGEVPIHFQLSERLHQVLIGNLNEFDFETVERMLRINYIRGEPLDEKEKVPTQKRAICGFTLELPDETASPLLVTDNFIGALQSEPIDHVVKFEDPLLQQELVGRAKELFDLEMKLRRVISVIYLRSYHFGPYDLLRDEMEKPMEPPHEAQMSAAAENEFFFLTFDQYVKLNRRPEIRQTQNLVSLIRENANYEDLVWELARPPIEEKDDAEFLAGLRALMDPIEKLRNCVAHNRRPSQKLSDDYLNAMPRVNQALDQFLIRLGYAWHDEMDDGESIEDREARGAVEWALEHAVWDKKSKTIMLYDPDDDRVRWTAKNREELEQHLRSVAEEAWYGYAPGPSADVAGTYDGDDCVCDTLEPFEERLEKFFAIEDEEENGPDQSK